MHRNILQTYEYERLGTNRACTSQSINPVPHNSRYKAVTHVPKAKRVEVANFCD